MNHIKTLIYRYLQGTTNCREEQEIKDYFATGNIAPELKKYAPLFSWQNDTTINDNSLDDIFARSTTELDKPIVIPVAKVRTKKLRHIAVWWSVAATIIVIVGATLFLTNRPTADQGPLIAQQHPKSVCHTPQADSTKPKPDTACQTNAKPTTHTQRHRTHCTTQPNIATNHNPEADPLDTYSDPEIAYAEAQRALQRLSDNLNRGLEMIDQAGNSNS